MHLEALLLWLRAFAVTQIVEVPIYRRTLGVTFWEAFGASAITHPIVWWLNASGVWHSPWEWRALLCESFAWAAEAAYFHFVFQRRRSALASLIANASSFGLGLAAFALFGG